MEIVIIYEKRCFKNLKTVWRRKVKSQSQSIDFDHTSTFYKIREKRWDNIKKIIFFETREKEENFDTKIMIF